MFYRRLTIATPVYNSFERLRKHLPTLLSLNYPRFLIDLIFVDNGSEDETRDVLRSFKDRYEQEYASITVDSISRIKQETAWLTKYCNIANARNRAVELSPPGNDILSFEDDATPPINGVERLIHLSDVYKADIASGYCLTVAYKTENNLRIPRILIPAFDKEEHEHLYPTLVKYTWRVLDSYPSNKEPVRVRAVGMIFTLIKRHVFDEIKFKIQTPLTHADPTQGEDVLFCGGAAFYGFSIVIDPCLRIYHW